MFVWERASDVTGSWHPEAGVLVIANDLERAREMLRAEAVKDSSDIFTNDPDYSTSVGANEEQVFIFPDAGCC